MGLLMLNGSVIESSVRVDAAAPSPPIRATGACDFGSTFFFRFVAVAPSGPSQSETDSARGRSVHRIGYRKRGTQGPFGPGIRT